MTFLIYTICAHIRDVFLSHSPSTHLRFAPCEQEDTGSDVAAAFQTLIVSCEPTTLSNNGHTCEKKQVFHGRMERCLLQRDILNHFPPESKRVEQ